MRLALSLSEAVVVDVSSPEATRVPTSIWSPGALLCSGFLEEQQFGHVVYVDPDVDYLMVRAYDFRSLGEAPVWSGTRKEFAQTWRFVQYEGVS